jgi:two-component sensor histidine kinase
LDTGAADRHRPSVLVADDNADMRAYLRQLLAPHYRVGLAGDGEEALSVIQATKPDIVLADVMMPRLDGYGLLERIRTDAAIADIPVVLLSARAGEEATVEGLNAGADDYLVKPFSARELLVRLSANLERARSRRLVREGEERFRALVNATSDVVYRMSPDWTEMRLLQGGGFLGEPGDDWIDTYLLAEDAPRVKTAIAEAISSQSPFEMEHRVRRADATVGWVFSRAIPILDPRGEVSEWFGAASDISERKGLEEHLRLVAHELDHRVKNNLAMTQAMAVQTFRDQGDGGAAQATFTARLMALARANDLLTGERWVGASLQTVLRQALDPYGVDDPQRCRLEGPTVPMSSKTALSLALATHELATNAMKYGAWSTPRGKVSVTWTVVDGETGSRLRLRWRESGGPRVSKPDRRGFGSRLIERGLAAEMEGEVSLDFRPEGLVCVIDATLRPDDADVPRWPLRFAASSSKTQ